MSRDLKLYVIRCLARLQCCWQEWVGGMCTVRRRAEERKSGFSNLLEGPFITPDSRVSVHQMHLSAELNWDVASSFYVYADIRPPEMGSGYFSAYLLAWFFSVAQTRNQKSRKLIYEAVVLAHGYTI